MASCLVVAGCKAARLVGVVGLAIWGLCWWRQQRSFWCFLALAGEMDVEDTCWNGGVDSLINDPFFKF